MLNLGRKPADLWSIFMKQHRWFPPFLSKESISSHKYPLWIYVGLLIASGRWNLQLETWRGLVLNQRRKPPPGEKHSFSSSVFSGSLKTTSGSELFPGCETGEGNRVLRCKMKQFSVWPQGMLTYRAVRYFQFKSQKKAGWGWKNKNGKISFSKTEVKLFLWMCHNIIVAR